MTWSLPAPPKQTSKMYHVLDGNQFYGEITKKGRVRDEAVFSGRGLLFK